MSFEIDYRGEGKKGTRKNGEDWNVVRWSIKSSHSSSLLLFLVMFPKFSSRSLRLYEREILGKAKKKKRKERP
jgi:hypothetical protein